MISNANPWDNLKFDLEGIAEVRRKFFGTFIIPIRFLQFMPISMDSNMKKKFVGTRPEIDQWILSRIEYFIKEVDGCYDDYEPTKAARAIPLCSGKLKQLVCSFMPSSFWKGDSRKIKLLLIKHFIPVWKLLRKFSAPIAPFFMDQLFQDLNQILGKNLAESVHLTDFPLVNEDLIDLSLVEKTHLAQQITSMVFSLRKRKISVYDSLCRKF